MSEVFSCDGMVDEDGSKANWKHIGVVQVRETWTEMVRVVPRRTDEFRMYFWR